jgi:plastocyanin
MRRLVPAMLAVAALVALAVAGISGAFSSGAKGMASTMQMSHGTGSPKSVPASVQLHRRVVRVTIHGFSYSPKRVVVSPGTRIVWTNQDSDPHTVTSDAAGGGLSSQALDTGGRFAAVVRRAGTIAYHCTIHPFMHGAVVVRGGAS